MTINGIKNVVMLICILTSVFIFSMSVFDNLCMLVGWMALVVSSATMSALIINDKIERYNHE